MQVRPLVVLACLILVAGPVRAEFVNANWTQATPALTLDLTLDQAGPTAPVNYNGVLVGKYNWNKTGGDANWLGNTFWTFCVELTQSIQNPTSYDITNLENVPGPGVGAGSGGSSTSGAMGATKANFVREWFHRFYNANFTNVEAAAFQLGIWEIIFDDSGTRNVTTGEFYVRNINTSSEISAKNKANNWLSQLTGQTGGFEYELVGLGSQYDQDQVTIRRILVPAPPGVVLAGVGLVGLLGFRRWRRPA